MRKYYIDQIYQMLQQCDTDTLAAVLKVFKRILRKNHNFPFIYAGK